MCKQNYKSTNEKCDMQLKIEYTGKNVSYEILKGPPQESL